MKKLLMLIGVVLAIISAIVAVIYFSKTAGALPHFFPGYDKGSVTKHVKHGLAFVGLAIVLLIGSWMVSGQKTVKPAPKVQEKNIDE